MFHEKLTAVKNNICYDNWGFYTGKGAGLALLKAAHEDVPVSL